MLQICVFTGLQLFFIGKYFIRSMNALFTDKLTHTAVISVTDRISRLQTDVILVIERRWLLVKQAYRKTHVLYFFVRNTKHAFFLFDIVDHISALKHFFQCHQRDTVLIFTIQFKDFIYIQKQTGRISSYDNVLVFIIKGNIASHAVVQQDISVINYK